MMHFGIVDSRWLWHDFSWKSSQKGTKVAENVEQHLLKTIQSSFSATVQVNLTAVQPTAIPLQDTNQQIAVETCTSTRRGNVELSTANP
jgi:hypothetical protein